MNKYSLLIFFLLSTISFAQSPWVKKEGDTYLQLSFTTINNYNTIFGSPDYFTEREIIDNTLQFYGEYGISDKTTIILNLPIKFIETGQLASNGTSISNANLITNLGNLEIGFKHQIYNNKWVIAGQLNVEANTGFYDNPSGIRTGVDAWSFTPTVNIGRSFKGFYIQTFSGVNLRTNNYSSSFKIGGEIGTRPIKNILLIAFVDIVESFENGNIILPVTNQLTSLYVNDQEYTSYGLKIIGEITSELGIYAGFGGAFSGNNVAKKTAITFGFYSLF